MIAIFLHLDSDCFPIRNYFLAGCASVREELADIDMDLLWLHCPPDFRCVHQAFIRSPIRSPCELHCCPAIYRCLPEAVLLLREELAPICRCLGYSDADIDSFRIMKILILFWAIYSFHDIFLLRAADATHSCLSVAIVYKVNGKNRKKIYPI